jgi:uncharacterized RDD family membrane protein YckC
MKKITELKTTLYRTETKKDLAGNRIRKQVPYVANRQVKVVSGGNRFAHYFLDGIIFNLLYYPIDLLLSKISIPTPTIAYLFSISFFPIILFYSLYYLVFEYFFQQTPGKMLTKSFVITEYGEKPDLKTLFLRNVIRLVPFEPFSCLNERGWHDRWSHTFVVGKEELNTLTALIDKDTEFKQELPEIN